MRESRIPLRSVRATHNLPQLAFPGWLAFHGF